MSSLVVRGRFSTRGSPGSGMHLRSLPAVSRARAQPLSMAALANAFVAVLAAPVDTGMSHVACGLTNPRPLSTAHPRNRRSPYSPSAHDPFSASLLRCMLLERPNTRPQNRLEARRRDTAPLRAHTHCSQPHPERRCAVASGAQRPRARRRNSQARPQHATRGGAAAHGATPSTQHAQHAASPDVTVASRSCQGPGRRAYACNAAPYRRPGTCPRRRATVPLTPPCMNTAHGGPRAVSPAPVVRASSRFTGGRSASHGIRTTCAHASSDCQGHHTRLVSHRHVSQEWGMPQARRPAWRRARLGAAAVQCWVVNMIFGGSGVENHIDKLIFVPSDWAR